MAAKVIAMYKRPADEAAFNARYFTAHLDLVRKIPGLQQIEVTRGLGKEAPYWLITEMTYADRDALMAATGSPESAAARADVQEFAADIITVVMVDELETWEPGT
ncbi:MAG TPA: EthD family reductase [Thermomicrobiales bacterium]|nr:EthD family reductase [Thermomicrobiales bacterium]